MSSTSEEQHERSQPLRILCVHQGWELYGSDRTFIQSVRAFRSAEPDAEIIIHLPRAGPIVERLTSLATAIKFQNMSVLRRRHATSWVRFAMNLPIRLYQASRAMRQFDFVYINTVVPIDYVLATRLFRRRSVVHVHEIPRTREQWFFNVLLSAARASIIFNSKATRDSYTIAVVESPTVVYNGVDLPASPCSIANLDGRRLRLLCIGRFNSRKGQEVLLAATEMLTSAQRRRVRVRFVGDTFSDQTRHIESLQASIAKASPELKLSIFPFTDDPSHHYEWCDIVVVPSTLPESFGLVAIEAMAHRRAVIASDHGGIAEIVVENETGRLVSPGSPAELAAAIGQYLDSWQQVERHGFNGRARVQANFSTQLYEAAMANLVR